jgi:hypothetical protein
VDDQVAHGVGFLAQEENIIKFAVNFLPQLRLKSENGAFLVEKLQKLLVPTPEEYTNITWTYDGEADAD